MKNTILLTSHSVGTKHEELAELLRPNKEAYAAHWGFELATLKQPYDDKSYTAGLEAIKSYLKQGRTVLSVGCDVIFTNFSKGIHDFPPFPVTIAQENLRWWPINNDVMIWKANCTQSAGPWAEEMASRLIKDEKIWLKYPWKWQNHLWNLICTEEHVRRSINIVPARRMNSTPHPGLSQWQLGDWICHLLDMPDEEKIKMAPKYLQFPDNGTFFP